MKWALVTGGARNLGRHLSECLSDEGYNIVIHYNKSEKQARDLQKRIQSKGKKAEIIQGDFSTQSSFEDFSRRYFQAFDDTYILINNVGNYYLNSLLDTSDEMFEELFRVNFTAAYLLAKRSLSSICKNKGGIVNIGFAGLSTHVSNLHSSVYTLTKSGLWMVTKMLAKQLAEHKVNVNMISPGYLEKSVEHPKQENKIVQYKEVGRLACFLLDRKNKSITGQNIEISKGVRL